MPPYSNTRTTPSQSTRQRRTRRPPSAVRQKSIRERDHEGLPWIVLPQDGPARVKMPPFRPAWVWPDGWGEHQGADGVWLIPRSRFTATAELLAERYAYVDVYLHFDARACLSEAHDGECTCTCFGWIAPSFGWLPRETVKTGSVVSVHAVLFEGHSLDGMFA